MLRTDLIETVNSGAAWAFIGSGVSADAGHPSWRQLVESTVESLPEISRTAVLEDVRYQRAWEAEQYPACLSAIERHSGRAALESRVVERLRSGIGATTIASVVASWPFAAYATSNYDSLLERVLEDQPGTWLGVGNSDGELPKVSRDARGVVWHVHGGVDLGSDKSRLVLTVQDYDSIYSDTSRLHRQMAGLLTQRRFVFVGFGFKDPDFVSLLKLVARYTDPARPIIAFLSDVPKDSAEQLELLENYNVDVIPYKIVNGSHHDLLEQMRLYGTFILKRSLQFNHPARACPSYDAETTALLTYNRLALGGGAQVSSDTLGALIRARVLASLRYRGSCTSNELTEDLLERTEILKQHFTGEGVQSYGSAIAMISSAIGELQESGLAVDIDSGTSEIALTEAGRRLIDEQSAHSQLSSDKFRASLGSRATLVEPNHPDVATRLAQAAETFLVECVTRRALGVAMAWHSPSTSFQQFHMVALLQELPRHVEELADVSEARGLVTLITDILAQPTSEESQYLGLLIQARFGLHLLGFDPDATAARIRALSDTVFLLDATTLIPLLGRSSIGHAAACQLIAEVKRVGATPLSTDLLAIEVAEHADWAQRQIGPGGELSSLRGLAASTGRAGAGSNVFIEGCLAEAESGRALDLARYLDSICQSPYGHTADDAVFRAAIDLAGVSCLALADWSGFQVTMWPERDQIQRRIKSRRLQNGSYTHDRQVQAEAEAVLVVNHLREGSIGIDGRKFTAAYFVSQTRIVDDMGGRGSPLTMRPQAVQQWLSTVTACPPEELEHIIDGMLWELSERGSNFVNTSRIANVFGSLISAAKEQMGEELTVNGNYIVQRYGEDAAQAFTNVKAENLPFVTESYFASKSKDLERRLTLEKAGRDAAERRAALVQRDKKELDELRATRLAVEARNKEKRRKQQGKSARKKKT